MSQLRIAMKQFVDIGTYHSFFSLSLSAMSTGAKIMPIAGQGLIPGSNKGRDKIVEARSLSGQGEGRTG